MEQSNMELIQFAQDLSNLTPYAFTLLVGVMVIYYQTRQLTNCKEYTLKMIEERLAEVKNVTEIVSKNTEALESVQEVMLKLKERL